MLGEVAGLGRQGCPGMDLPARLQLKEHLSPVDDTEGRANPDLIYLLKEDGG